MTLKEKVSKKLESLQEYVGYLKGYQKCKGLLIRL